MRTLAVRHSARISELVAAVGMSKNAVIAAVDSLEESGAVTTHREGRDTIVEALDSAEPMFAAMVLFDERAQAPAAVLPTPGVPLTVDERRRFADHLAACGARPVPDRDWQPDELGVGIAPAWAGRAPVG